jgi:hypothetical protein
MISWPEIKLGYFTRIKKRCAVKTLQKLISVYEATLFLSIFKSQTLRINFKMRSQLDFLSVVTEETVLSMGLHSPT